MHGRDPKLKKAQDQAAEMSRLLGGTIKKTAEIPEINTSSWGRYESIFARDPSAKVQEQTVNNQEEKSGCCSKWFGCLFSNNPSKKTAIKVEKVDPKKILPVYRRL